MPARSTTARVVARMTSAMHTHSVMTPEEVAESSRLDTKRLRAECPEVADRYTTTSTRDGGLRFAATKRVLETIAGHECVVSVMGDSVYDRDGHGTWYLCRYVSDADALSRWRGWLRSQGVDA